MIGRVRGDGTTQWATEVTLYALLIILVERRRWVASDLQNILRGTKTIKTLTQQPASGRGHRVLTRTSSRYAS